MKDFIKNELICLRAAEPVGSDRYNELSDAVQWIEEHTVKEQNASNTESSGKYAHTRIQWKDGNSEQDVIIAVGCKNDDRTDDQIFFYCNNMDDFERLKHYDNGEDFVIIGCTMFTDTLD